MGDKLFVRLLPYCRELGWVKKTHSAAGRDYVAGHWMEATPDQVDRVRTMREVHGDLASPLAFQVAETREAAQRMTAVADLQVRATRGDLPDALASTATMNAPETEPTKAEVKEKAPEPAAVEKQAAALARSVREQLEPAAEEKPRTAPKQRRRR